MTVRALTLLIAMTLLPSVALAAPARYSLVPEQSIVGFDVAFGPDLITGTMPVGDADLLLDFDRAANSRVSVTLNAAAAQANFLFATQAMRGPKVLDARAYPTIVFRSTSVRATGPNSAMMSGDLTVRGVTRQVTLDTRLFRQGDTGDLSQLSLSLTGSVPRSAFGATGWSDMVADTVNLRILTRIRRIE